MKYKDNWEETRRKFTGYWEHQNTGRPMMCVIARQPEMKGTITTTMFMGCAVAETTGLYSLIIALILLFVNPFTGLF